MADRAAASPLPGVGQSSSHGIKRLFIHFLNISRFGKYRKLDWALKFASRNDEIFFAILFEKWTCFVLSAAGILFRNTQNDCRCSQVSTDYREFEDDCKILFRWEQTSVKTRNELVWLRMDKIKTLGPKII